VNGGSAFQNSRASFVLSNFLCLLRTHYENPESAHASGREVKCLPQSHLAQ